MIPRVVKKYLKEIESDGEKVYLRKDKLGWRVVNPDKLILGGKRNIIILIVLLIIIAFFFFAYAELSNQMNDMILNPCNYTYFENVSCIKWTK